MNSDFFTGLSLIMHGPAGGCACGRPAQKSNAGELDGRLDGAVVGLFGAAFALPVFTMQKLVRKRTAGLAEEVPVEPVSYTHLDVYKRQDYDTGVKPGCYSG